MARRDDNEREINVLDVFDEVAKASASLGAKYLEPGRFVLEINKLLLKIGNKDDTLFFIAEFVVVESSREDTTPGMSRTWLVDLDKKTGKEKPGPRSVKAFAMALAPDLAEEDIAKEDLAQLVGDNQPAVGIKVKCEAWHTETEKGGLFTRTKWEYHSGELNIKG